MRRRVMRSVIPVAAAVAAGVLAGCSLSTEPEPRDGEDAGATGVAVRGGTGQAPMLAALVESGDLPPLEDRLPAEPLVVEPVEEIGVYGGEWRSALLSVSDDPWLKRTIGYEGLLRWDPEWTEPIPNLAASFEVNDDATEYTFQLREDLRWSDGEPFTAEDVQFWWDAVVLREDALEDGGAPGWMRPSGEEADTTVEAVDDLTLRFTFTEPNGLLPQWMAGNDGSEMVSIPAHYCGEFHEDYNEDVAAVVAEEGAEDWADLFTARGCTGSGGSEYWQTTGIPTMHPWLLTTEYGSGSRVEAERNPYYWKVDTEGNQLPYLDRIVYSVVENEEVMLLNASAGELDYHARAINRLRNRPVLVENSERGGYRLFDMVEAEMNTTMVHLNLTAPDPVLAEAFLGQDLRIGLSHAIDRQEIIDIVYQGQGEPWQGGPRPESGDLHHEELGTQYTEFDVEEANRLLDEAGYAERNGDGIRLLPDGRPLAFGVLVRTDQTEQVDALNLVRRMWQAVGVDLRIDAVDRTLWEERRDSGEYEAIASDGSGGMRDAFLENDNYMAAGDGDSALWAPQWSAWLDSGGEEGQEAPEPAQRQADLYADVKASRDPDEQVELMQQILDIAQEEFWTMGISLPQAHYGIAGENFRNVPEGFADSSRFGTPGPVNPAQFFLADGGGA